jgi:hypothetical protein
MTLTLLKNSRVYEIEICSTQYGSVPIYAEVKQKRQTQERRNP